MVRLRWILQLAVVVISCATKDDANKTLIVAPHGTMAVVVADGLEDTRVFEKKLGIDHWTELPHDLPLINTEVSNTPATHNTPVQKRRRLRKRKRRPQPPVLSITEGESDNTEDRLVLKQSAHRLDDVHEPWKEMEEQGAQRTSSRRRVSPVYVSVDQLGGVSDKKDVQGLKMLLKQSDGQSLSEILQQRNLSLADLLRGQQAAISALTDRPDSKLNEDQLVVKPSRYKEPQRIVEAEERNLNKDIINAQRKRLSILYNKENKLYSDLTKYDVITEATTEKRIFVPSHPKYYTSIDYRPGLEDVSDKVFVIGRIKTNLMSNIVKEDRTKLPITSAKLMKKAPKIKLETIVPNQATKIDLFGFAKSAGNNDKGPLKMTIDLDGIIKTTQRTDADNIRTNLIPDDSTTTWPTVKLKTVSAKDEIMEVLRDEMTKDKLTELLRLRNMTIEELVEQRERGSSQRHLADIFHNESTEGVIVPKNAQSTIKPDLIYQQIETNEDAAWKSVDPTMQSNSLSKGTDQTNLFIREMQQIDEIENVIEEDKEESFSIPYGVKSAIFASLVIIGVSLIVFLTVLVIFRWTQRHKTRPSYGDSFACSKSKSPILDPRQRSLRTIMNETLGRKKSVYEAQLHDSWADADGKLCNK